jgi:hypothetical protein
MGYIQRKYDAADSTLQHLKSECTISNMGKSNVKQPEPRGMGGTRGDYIMPEVACPDSLARTP